MPYLVFSIAQIAREEIVSLIRIFVELERPKFFSLSIYGHAYVYINFRLWL